MYQCGLAGHGCSWPKADIGRNLQLAGAGASGARHFLLPKSVPSDVASVPRAQSCGKIQLQELDMRREDKSVDSNKQQRQAAAIEKGQQQKGVGRPETDARAWAAANKLHSGDKKTASRRKLPSGPLGGSGRKTNLARSS
jgi:hypothetical protein